MDMITPEKDNLKMREDSKKGVYVPGLTTFEVQDKDEALELVNHGLKSRIISSTQMNE
jgi:hypothetical protein